VLKQFDFLNYQDQALRILSYLIPRPQENTENTIIISLLAIWTVYTLKNPDAIDNFYEWPGTKEIPNAFEFLRVALYNKKIEGVKKLILQPFQLFSQYITHNKGERPLVYILKSL